VGDASDRGPTGSATATSGGAAGASGAAVGATSGQGSAGSASPQLPTAAHPYARYEITGNRSGIHGSVLVRLPPTYFAPANAHRTFPVIETFHGSPGHAPQWLGKLRLGDVIDRRVAAHRIADAIVVSPDMNYPDQQDRECVDAGPGQPALETWAAEDVPDWVTHTFRTRTDRDGWATIGLSTGGWCAAMSAMLHPDRYRAAIVMSGYFRPPIPGRYAYLFG
jgi:enterochelin esterase-like enzyme